MDIDIKVSIIIPIYNSEKYLNKCIESILEQTLKNIEIILINDGSTDLSEKICNEYAFKDSRIKIITQKNLGVSTARNYGIDIARGKYIMFCDSDDFVEREWCEDIYNLIKENEESFVISGYSTINYRHKDIVIHDKVFSENDHISKVSKDRFYDLFQKNLSNSPCNKIYSTEVIRKYNIKFDDSLSLGEDLLFNLEYMKYTKDVIVLNKKLYNYIFRDIESLDNKYYENLFEIYNKIYTSIYRYMNEFNVDLKKEEKNFYKSYLYMLLYVLKNTLSKKNKSSFIEKIKYNSKLLKSNEFEECLNKADLSGINKHYLKLLKRGKYIYIYIFDKMVMFKEQLYSLI